ncbi:MAG: sulfurtransferase TusA family protein [Bacillota bacterium]
MDGNIVDARGLSCPQPVILTVEAIKNDIQGEIVILVDTDTSRENVIRAAKSGKWQVLDIQPDDDGYRIKIGKEK